MNPATENKLHFWLPFWGFVSLNLLLKGIFLTWNELSYDETFTFYHARLAPGQIIAELLKGNNPPFYELFMHYWMQLAGSSLFALRLPSLIFAAFVPAFWYGAVYRSGQQQTACVMALLLSINNQQLMFAHEMRGYALAFFLSSAALFCFFQIRNTWLSAVLTGLCLSLAIYTHYLAVFSSGIAWLFMLLYGIDKRNRAWFSAILALVFIMPLLWVFCRRISDPGNTLWGNAPAISHLWGNFNIAFNYRFWPVIAVFLLSMADKKVRTRWKQIRFHLPGIRPALVLLAVFTGSYLFLFAISFRWPMFMDRYLSFIFPAFFFCIAFAGSYFYQSAGRTRGWLILLLLIVLSGFNWRQGNDYHPALTAAEIRRFRPADADTRVIVYPEWYHLTIAYYLDDSLRQQNVYDLRNSLLRRNIIPATSPEEIREKIRSEVPVRLLYLDAGEEFVFGNRAMYHMFSEAGYIQSAPPRRTDKQVTLYTFTRQQP